MRPRAPHVDSTLDNIQNIWIFHILSHQCAEVRLIDRLDIRKLRQIVVVAKSGSYTRAAHTLNISPSALSRSIKSIEDILGVTLFHRGRGGVFPTTPGSRIISSASKLLSSVDDFNKSLLPLGDLKWGSVSIGMGPMPASVLLKDLFGEIIDKKDMRIDVDIDSGEKLIEKLNSGKIEFFMCAEPAVVRPKNLKIDIITCFELSALVHHSHPLVGRNDISIDELVLYPIAGPYFSIDSSNGRNWDINPILYPTVSCNSFDILSNVVMSSQAIGLFPISFISDELVELDCLPGAFMRKLPIVIVQPKFKQLSPAGVHLMASLMEIVDRLPGRQP